MPVQNAISLVQTQIDGSVGTIALDNPAKRNALSHALIEQVIGTLNQFKEAKVRVVILRSAPGCKVWSAGHDVTELAGVGRDPLGWDDPLKILVRALQEFPAPVIAVIEAGVWGGACEVAIACDILVATPNASFAITPARLGLPYNLGGLLTLMNAIPHPVAKEMLFTADPIPAEQARNLGIVSHVKTAEEIDGFVADLTARIVRNAPLSIAVMKEQMRLLASAHAISPELFERIQGLRQIVFDSRDYQEGLDAFRQKRKPVFEGR